MAYALLTPLFDAVNDTRNMEVPVKAAKKAGKHVQGTICYTISPVHTNDAFVAMAKELAALDCDSICVKDMAALLKPQPALEPERSLQTLTTCGCASSIDSADRRVVARRCGSSL